MTRTNLMTEEEFAESLIQNPEAYLDDSRIFNTDSKRGFGRYLEECAVRLVGESASYSHVKAVTESLKRAAMDGICDAIEHAITVRATSKGFQVLVPLGTSGKAVVATTLCSVEGTYDPDLEGEAEVASVDVAEILRPYVENSDSNPD